MCYLINLILFVLLSIKKVAPQNTIISNFMDISLEQEIIDQQIHHNQLYNQDNELELQMLELLGLLNRPRKTANYPSLSKSSSRFLYEIYQTLTINEESEYMAMNSKNRYTRSTSNFNTDYNKMEIENCNNIITFSSINNQRQSSSELGMKIKFNTNDIPRDFLLRRAELRLYQNLTLLKSFVTNADSSDDYTISVYTDRNHKNDGKNSILLTSVNATLHYQGWLEIDVTAGLTKWLSNKDMKNNNMFVKVYRTDNLNLELSLENIGLISTPGEDKFQPFLVGFFHGPEVISNLKTMRLKRNIPIRKKYDGAQRLPDANFKSPKMCQRMNFTVDFRDLNWQNWIIAPEKFEAYFCSGECNFPLGNGMNATNHALVQTLMHLKKPWLPKPCCAPKELSSISVLYHLNDENVNLRTYQHMVANSCGCH